MKKVLLLLGTIVCFASCKKDQTLNPTLNGTWELRNLTSGWGVNKDYAPGNGNWYIFSSGNTYRKDTSNKVAAQGTFSVEFNGTEINGFKSGVIRFNKPEDSDAIQVKPDSIYIGTTIADGPSYLYVRIK